VGVQEVRWVKCGSESADNYTFYCGNGDANHHLRAVFVVHKGIISAIKRVKFVVGCGV
jgi:hypothetical protein